MRRVGRENVREVAQLMIAEGCLEKIDSVEEWLLRAPEDTLVLELLRTVTGCVRLGEGGWVSGLVVAPACRGRGFGTKLMAWAEEEARRRGYASLRLWTTGTGELFRRIGFEQVGLREEHGEVVTIYEKPISSPLKKMCHSGP